MHSPDPLDPLLERWAARQPKPPPSDALQQEVWRRIADADDANAELTWIARIEAVFSRPSFAAVFVAACALFGLFLAQVRVSRVQNERSLQLAHAYIRLIDPLLDTAAPSATSQSGRALP